MVGLAMLIWFGVGIYGLWFGLATLYAWGGPILALLGFFLFPGTVTFVPLIVGFGAGWR